MERNVILMFPGQGSQAKGMGKDIAADFQEFDHTLEEASDTLGISMRSLFFDDPDEKLNLTEYTQPAILTFSTGIVRVLRERAGIVPSFVAGHSLGEYSALVALGALNFTDALKAVRFRGQAMQRAVPVGVGSMAAYIGTKCEEVAKLCQTRSRQDSVVEVVNFNSASQMVLSGHKEAVADIEREITQQKLGRAIPLSVSAPFHSSLMKPAADEMKFYFQDLALKAFDGKITANLDAKIHKSADYGTDHLVKQIWNPVLWTQSLRNMVATGEVDEWIEVGPGNVLQGMLRKTLENQKSAGTADLASLKNLLTRAGS